MIAHEIFMKKAIKKAEEGIKKGQSPFGACIVKDLKVISCTHNTVLKSKDATAHAEINAIRDACKKLKSYDLSGCIIYSTTEPCPMCFSAIHWARISKIVYGSEIYDAKKAGFNELLISNKTLKKISNVSVQIEPNILKHECNNLFLKWNMQKNKKTY